MARALLVVLEAYRVTLSPLLGGHCRYLPSCSVFAEEAIRRHGARRGARLAVGRVLRCHPFHRGGYDPVP
jgi:putative membrane protein insertion efficiency factor